MPDTKEETLLEINRLTEWCNDMTEMILSDGTVPANMKPAYQRQVEQGQTHLGKLIVKAREKGWMV